MNSIELKNIECKFEKRKVINNISFKINKGDIISIIGGMAAGKTTLAKVLSGSIKYKGDLLINGVEIVKENKYLISRFINVISNDINDKRKVVDVLFDALDDTDNSQEIINEYINSFNIDFLNNYMNELSYDNYFYILIIAGIIKNVDYIVLDDIMCYLNDNMINKIMSFIKDKKISIINITSNIDEIVYSSYAYFLYDGKIVMEGNIDSCLREEKLLKRLGFNLPFIVDLSTQLMYYNVLDKIYYDEKEMVDAIWN